MRSTRFQFGLTLLAGLFLLATLFAVLLYAYTPSTPASKGSILLASFIAILIGSLLCILFMLRWLLRPYRQLVGEAERASVTSQIHKSKDEAAFVLETFQSVVAQLQEQRKELEKLSAQARERADSAERFSDRIVASVPSGLIAFDGNGYSMALNGPGRELIEVDGQALGQPFQALLNGYPRLTEMVRQCLETGRLFRREEIEATTPDGHTRRIGATVAPIDLSPERGPRGALCLLTDITEVTQLREQVALKNNLESLGEMSAGLAHEFKNAIAALQGYVQLLQSLELDEKGGVVAASLLNEVRNLSEMVTSFLNFARPQPLELESISLIELLSECTTELESLYDNLGVELKVEAVTDGDKLELPADERMLRQALLNLLRNAAEAISDEQTVRLVQVRAFRDSASAIALEIKDTGDGIPNSQLQKIFIPFFTTKSTGHGVGLALAHRVVTEHGGTLTAGNAPEGGAVFTIRLPNLIR
jgi:nitrogen fixation/metabolism regulation signal transduction histidine kinase